MQIVFYDTSMCTVEKVSQRRESENLLKKLVDICDFLANYNSISDIQGLGFF